MYARTAVPAGRRRFEENGFFALFPASPASPSLRIIGWRDAMRAASTAAMEKKLFVMSFPPQ
jgi:hypothetical protein